MLSILKRIFLLSIFILIFLSYKYFSSSNYNDYYESYKVSPHLSNQFNIFQSECYCRKEEKIFFTKDFNASSFKVQSSFKNKKEYYLSKLELQNIRCNFYSALRRGKHTKVIGYSLYGKNMEYYNRLPGMIMLILIKIRRILIFKFF